MDTWRSDKSTATRRRPAMFNAAARIRQRERGELEAYGVQYVLVTSDEDPRGCPRCARVVGAIMPLPAAPRLPIVGCRGECSCRLSPVSLE